MAYKPTVGDYVRALEITHVPFDEVNIDMTREGLVVETRDNGAGLVLETWRGDEFICYAAGAFVVDIAKLDTSIQSFILKRKRGLAHT